MSRWSRKTQEEKQQISDNINHQQTIKEDKAKKMDYIGTDFRLKILKEGELPLYCDKHGWTKSNQYTLENRNNMFGNFIVIIGNCPTCNKRIESLVAKDPMYMMMVSLNLAKLKLQGRITDRREKK